MLLNNCTKKFKAIGKISFYPLGIANYMEHIAFTGKIAADRGLNLESSCDVCILRGDVNELFDYFDAVLAYAEQNISHYVLQITLSVNSPSGAI